MLDLFDRAADKQRLETAPLAEKLRPQDLDDYVAQGDLLGPDKPLRKLIEMDQVLSLIPWGAR